jgi:hypothetical protein
MPCLSRRVLAAAAMVLGVTFTSSNVDAQTTALFLDSQSGDPVGGGRTQTLTPPEFTFAAGQPIGSVARGAIVGVSSNDLGIGWTLVFSSTAGAALLPGVYEDAGVWEGRQDHVSGEGEFSSEVTAQFEVFENATGSCELAAGRFIVYEFAVDTSGGITRFAADFEQHCSGATPALFGAIRFNSTRSSLVPFGGAYPVYSLKVDAAANGYVTGPGIDCGAGRTDCEETYSADAMVTVHAEPSLVMCFSAGPVIA